MRMHDGPAVGGSADARSSCCGFRCGSPRHGADYLRDGARDGPGFRGLLGRPGPSRQLRAASQQIFKQHPVRGLLRSAVQPKFLAVVVQA
jgi:hypothetical protein